MKIQKVLLNDMDDIYKNNEEYNLGKKRKILIIFNDTIADMLSNQKLNPIVTELLIKGKKLNISLAFIMQSHFTLCKSHLIIHLILNLKAL